MTLCKYLLLFAMLIGSFGCKKLESETYHGVIKNGIGETVYLDFYSTLDDYNNSQNLLKSLAVPAFGEIEVPAEFEDGAKLYLDWYTEDYGQSNWGTEAKFAVPTVTKDFGPILTITPRMTPARQVWLSGKKGMSTWEAFDYRYYSSSSTSYWSTLSANQKIKQFVIRKNLTGTYTYKETSGATTNLNFTFQVFNSSSSQNSIIINFPSFPGSGFIIGTIPSGFGYSADTIYTPNYFPPETQSSSFNYIFRRLP